MPTATNGRSAAATPACAETAAVHSWLKAALPLAAVCDLVLGTAHQFWFILYTLKREWRDFYLGERKSVILPDEMEWWSNGVLLTGATLDYSIIAIPLYSNPASVHDSITPILRFLRHACPQTGREVLILTSPSSPSQGSV
jgi:hypothetical protein